MVQQLKLNHGLFLDGYDIQSSNKEAIFIDDDNLNIRLYKGQPIVYTNINDPKNDDITSSNDSLHIQSSNTCINFPIAEITYKGHLFESSFSIHDENLHELYGHLFARKFLIGNKLFIKDSHLATLTQIDLFKFHITWAYNSAKYNAVNPFNNSLPLLPGIETLDGKKLNLEKLASWMSDLYQKNLFEIISYNDLIPISQIISPDSSETSNKQNEKQPGVANYKEKLGLEEWVGDVIYNLAKWVKDFHFLQGLVIDKYYKTEPSRKIAASFIKMPNVKLSDKSYLEIVKPTTKMEESLIFNNIFSIKDISSFPFC